MATVKVPERCALAAVAVSAAISLTAGCAHRPPPPPIEPVVLERVPVDAWPDMTDDGEPDSLAAACAATGGYLDQTPADRVFAFGAYRRTAGELELGLRRACDIVMSGGAAGERQRRIQDEFILLRSTGRDGTGEVLFTGYFEPLLTARRVPSGRFIHPVYGVPDDLITVDLDDFGVAAEPSPLVGRVEARRLVPYPDREAIDYDDALTDGVEVLGFVDDPIELFFLHVQGSGTLVFPDGGRLRAGYATSNGRPYRSIGRLLIDEGAVSRQQMSMQAITDYLRDHPEDLKRVLSFNPSYVFFRPLPAAGGPLGCYGEPLTGGRSIATDRRLFPAPVMAWVRATIPGHDGDEPIARFVLNQDTGGSIRGPGRVDLFFGQGDRAGEIAGHTKHIGELYVLLPKRTADRARHEQRERSMAPGSNVTR
jgi:membrane-bound lytic murein transglycosylase A